MSAAAAPSFTTARSASQHAPAQSSDSDSDDERDDTGVIADSAAYPYASNPDYADIEPIPQDDGPNPVVPIAYLPMFVETMNYFRALLKKDEKSERALRLTAHVIVLNPANYTAWYFRRLCVLALKKDVYEELAWCEKVAKRSPKNYQLWHHRRSLLDLLEKPPTNELALLDAIFAKDAKNYHVWSHRQWVLQRFNLWDGEIAFVEKLIDADVRNNSAWNQRHFVIDTAPGLGFTRERIAAEILYARKCIFLAVSNESPWNYLRGLTYKPAFDQHAAIQKIITDVEKFEPLCVFALGLRVDMALRSESVHEVADAIQACGILAETADVIRAKYWVFERAALQHKLKSMSSAQGGASSSASSNTPSSDAGKA